MDERTKEILAELREYLDKSEASYEAIETLARIALMAVAGMSEFASLISEQPGGVDKLAESTQNISTGLLGLMRVVKPDAQLFELSD